MERLRDLDEKFAGLGLECWETWMRRLEHLDGEIAELGWEHQASLYKFLILDPRSLSCSKENFEDSLHPKQHSVLIFFENKLAKTFLAAKTSNGLSLMV
jgi:hypothetical protein